MSVNNVHLKVGQDAQQGRSNPKILLWVSVFAVIGAATLILSRAATPFASVEVPSGTVTGNATTVADGTATNGSTVLFQSTTPPSPSPQGTWVNVSPPTDYAFSSPDNFGIHSIANSRSNTNVIYVGTSYRGIWKTTNAGASWTQLSVKMENSDNPCESLLSGRVWSIDVHPTNPNIVYAANGYGCRQGVWKTVDGGQTWTKGVPDSILQTTTPDVGLIAFDPYDGNHILVGSHGDWSIGGSGLIETKDGGVTWTQRRPGGGNGMRVKALAFLNDSNSWLVADESGGTVVTRNGGVTWTDRNATTGSTPHAVLRGTPHGGGGVYRAANGTLYATGKQNIARSTDGGSNWTQIHNGECGEGFMAVIGDGTRLYAAPANTGGTTCGNWGPGKSRYFTALESNDTSWSYYNSQLLNNGPIGMVHDKVNNAILSANWLAGVWKLQL